MGMQTDVLASKAVTSTNQLTDQADNNLARCRVKAIYVVPGAQAGSVVFRDGGASGALKLTVNTVASATQPTYLLLPGEGMLFSTNVHATVSNAGSVMVFYG